MYQKRIAFFTISILITLSGQLLAQQTGIKNIFSIQTKGTKIISAQKTVTRIAPNLGAAIDDTLLFGTPVNILLKVPFSESKFGMEIPWLKCTYKKGEFNRVTFILATDISFSQIVSNSSTAMLSFSNKINDSIYLSFSIINPSNDTYTKIFGFQQDTKIDSVILNTINNQGLKNISHIFEANIYTPKTVTTYNFLKQLTSTASIALEKTEFSLNNNTLEGNKWVFPSSKEVKKNQLGLSNFSKEMGNTIKKFKFKNGALIAIK